MQVDEREWIDSKGVGLGRGGSNGCHSAKD